MSVDVRELWGTSLRRNSFALAEAIVSPPLNRIHVHTEKLRKKRVCWKERRLRTIENYSLMSDGAAGISHGQVVPSGDRQL